MIKYENEQAERAQIVVKLAEQTRRPACKLFMQDPKENYEHFFHA